MASHSHVSVKERAPTKSDLLGVAVAIDPFTTVEKTKIIKVFQ